MKNSEFFYKDLYEMIRSYYLSNFPYDSVFQPHEAINLYLSNEGVHGSVVRTSNSYTFDNISPTSIENNTYDESYLDRIFRIEKYLANDDELSKVVSDLNQFKVWLEGEAFLRKDGKPSLLMLQTPKI